MGHDKFIWNRVKLTFFASHKQEYDFITYEWLNNLFVSDSFSRFISKLVLWYKKLGTYPTYAVSAQLKRSETGKLKCTKHSGELLYQFYYWTCFSCRERGVRMYVLRCWKFGFWQAKLCVVDCLVLSLLLFYR